MWALMNTSPSGCLVWLAVVCTSFSAVNVGRSKRSATTPWGDTNLSYVNLGNLLLSRTILLILLATCLGKTWVVEQPGGSLLPFYPRWEKLIATIKPIYRAAWWARHYKSLTPNLVMNSIVLLQCFLFGTFSIYIIHGVSPQEVFIHLTPRNSKHDL